MKGVDYVQNSQINSNPQDWNTLHKSVRNIQDLTRVVAETNNEAHYIHERANQAVEIATNAVNNVQGMTDEYKEHAAATMKEMEEHATNTMKAMEEHSTNTMATIDGHIDTVEEHVSTTTQHVSATEQQVQLASNHEVEAKVAKEQARLYAEEAQGHADSIQGINEVLMITDTTASRYNNLMVRLKDAIAAGDGSYDRLTAEDIRVLEGQGVPWEAILFLGWEMAAHFTAVFGGNRELQSRFGNFAIREMSPEIQEHLAYCMAIWNSNLFAEIDDPEARLRKIKDKILGIRQGRPIFLGRVFDVLLEDEKFGLKA